MLGLFAMPIERTTMATQHIVQTTHIQRLIRNGLELAERCNGRPADSKVIVSAVPLNEAVKDTLDTLTVHALQKAAADLRHAAEELEAERLSCLGWAQV